MRHYGESRKQPGFTIVELLIVIVVIAILATISIVAYSGIQRRARDSLRKSDLATIAKAIELYSADNGSYPPSQVGWCTQIANPSYTQVADAIKSYIKKLPQDPLYRDTYRDYFYVNNGTSYGLWAQMEGTGNGSYATGGCTTIGSTSNTYNYAQNQ